MNQKTGKYSRTNKAFYDLAIENMPQNLSTLNTLENTDSKLELQNGPRSGG